jgi:hypothetical protein
MHVFYFILTNLLISVTSYANTTCVKSKFSFQTYSGIKASQDEFCYKKEYYYSKNCLSNECINLKRLDQIRKSKRYDIGNFDSRYGTREFKLCSDLGGKGQIISLVITGKKVKTARCLLDKGFVEANYLEFLYLKGL